jgi:hypothetical protein
MNFDKMPELHWGFGYPFALILMAAVGVSILFYFRYRGWIGAADAAALRRKKWERKR